MSLFRVAQTADSGFSVIASKRSRGSNPAPEIETGIVRSAYWLCAPAVAKPLRYLQDGKAVAEKVTVACDSPKNPLPKKRRRITPAEGISPGRLPEKAKGAVKTSRSVPKSAKFFIPLISKRRLPVIRAEWGGPAACFLRNTFLKSFGEGCGLGTSSLRVEAPRLM